MNILIKKKQLLTATLVIALGAAVTVNWYYSNPMTKSDDTTSAYTQGVEGALGDSLYVAGTTQDSSEDTTGESQNSNDDTSTQEDEQTLKLNQTQEKFFADAKLNRQTSHDEILDNIKEILENDDATQAQKTSAEKMLTDFTMSLKTETDCESLIKSKTNSECLVVINNDNVQVVMQKNSLNETVILQISEIIEKNTEISPENLTIIEAK